MKINRRNFMLVSAAASLVAPKLSFGFAEPEDYYRSQTGKTFPVTGKQVKVYTTAAQTNYRISLTDTLSFRAMGQPKETQICVFIDPTKQFQSFLGIGGALTDAAAEVFAT